MPSKAFFLLLVGEHFGKKAGLASWTGDVKRIGVSLPNSVSASNWTTKANVGESKGRHAFLSPAYTANTQNPSERSS